jgi:hypothetical protein
VCHKRSLVTYRKRAVKGREDVITSVKVNSRAGADSTDQANATDIQKTAGAKLNLASLDGSATASGQSATDASEGAGIAVSRADPPLRPAQYAHPNRRSSTSLAECQERVIEAFWQDTRLGAAAPAPHRGLLESLEAATAALNSEHEDIAASQRLAERFARQPVQMPRQQAVPRQPAAFRPYIVAAAFMVCVMGGAAGYFLKATGGPKRAADGIARAAAIAPAAEERLDSFSFDERDPPPQGAFVPSHPIEEQAGLTEPGGRVAAPGSDEDSAGSWASAVETLRQLANAPQQAKEGKPESKQLLQQLEAWHKASEER